MKYIFYLFFYFIYLFIYLFLLLFSGTQLSICVQVATPLQISALKYEKIERLRRERKMTILGSFAASIFARATGICSVSWSEKHPDLTNINACNIDSTRHLTNDHVLYYSGVNKGR